MQIFYLDFKVYFNIRRKTHLMPFLGVSTQDTGLNDKILSNCCTKEKLLEGVLRNPSAEPQLKYLHDFCV